jgi:hypothetical protein
MLHLTCIAYLKTALTSISLKTWWRLNADDPGYSNFASVSSEGNFSLASGLSIAVVFGFASVFQLFINYL